MVERHNIEMLQQSTRRSVLRKIKKAKLEEKVKNIGLCHFTGKLLPISDAKQAAEKCTAKSTQEHVTS